MLKVGINGFGRIGRLIARNLLKDKNMILSGVNHHSMSRIY